MGKRITTEEFIEKARKVHGDKYDYSKVEYIKSSQKVCIICPTHGEFWQTPNAHLSGQGCPYCYGNNKITTKTFINKAIKVHGIKYNYSKVNYINAKVKVCIICPIHGEFWQTPDCHLNQRQGCPYCNGGIKYTREQFIKKSKEIHGNKYDYSKVEYVNSQTKVCIICPKHGEFWQTPNDHLNGKGCNNCNTSKLEKKIKFSLENKSITYEEQKKFEWLKNEKKLFLDFYIPNCNIAIECQGIQHFQNVEYFGGENKHKTRLERDKLKKQLCDEHGIEVVYFTHEKVEGEYLGKVFTDINDLIEYINSKKE